MNKGVQSTLLPTLVPYGVPLLAIAIGFISRDLNSVGGGYLSFSCGILAEHFPELIEREGRYALQRCLGSWIIHTAHNRVLHTAPPPRELVILSFWILNSLVLIATTFVLNAIAGRLKLNVPARLFLVLAVILNYGTAKLTFYIPAQPYAIEALVSALGFLFYLRNRLLLLPLAAVTGYIAPVIHLLLLLLYVLPGPRPAPWATDHDDPTDSAHRIARLWALALTAVTAAWCVYSIAQTAISPQEPVWWYALPITLPVLLGLVYFGVAHLMRDAAFGAARLTVQSISWRIPIAIAVYALVHYLQYLRVPKPETELFLSLATIWPLHGMQKPAVSILGHIDHFGPGFLIALLLWPRVAGQARAFGIGVVAILGVFTILMIDSEAHHHPMGFVFLFIVAAKVVSDLGWQAQHVWIFAALGFFVSRLWIQFDAFIPTDWDANRYAEFPLQLYYMGSTPWMSTAGYAIHWGVVAIMGAIFWRFFPRAPEAHRGR